MQPRRIEQDLLGLEVRERYTWGVRVSVASGDGGPAPGVDVLPGPACRRPG